MVEFTGNIYTGPERFITHQGYKGNAALTQRNAELADQKKKEKEELYRKNWEAFKNDLSVPREYIASQSAAESVGKEISDFHDKWGSLVQESPDRRLSEAQQIEMMGEKSLIEVHQQKALRDMDEYKKQQQLVLTNPTKYNVDEWLSKEQQYLSTGEWSSAPPSLNPMPIQELYRSTKVTTANAFTDPVSGTKYSATKEDVIPIIVNDVHTNDQIRQHAQDSWDALPVDDTKNVDGSTKHGKKWYLDTNKDNVLSESEKNVTLRPYADNPIVQFYIDDNWKYLVRATPKSTSTATSTKSTTNKGEKVMLGTREVVMPVGEKRSVPLNYGGISRHNLYSFGGTFTLTDIPSDEAYVIRDTRVDTSPIGGGNIAAAKLKDYDADKDVLIVQTTTGDPTLGIERVQLIQVPASKIPFSDNFPVMVDGKLSTLGALRAQRGSTQPAQEDKWKKYQR